MGERERRRIRAYLRSGEKQHKDILALFKGGEPSARTIERDLKSLVDWGEVKKWRKDRWTMYRLAGVEAQQPEFPPYDEAPSKLVDQEINRLETALEIPETCLIAALDFADLCQSYKKVAYSPDMTTRIYRILDHVLERFKDFPDEEKYQLVRIFDILVKRSIEGKENPRIISESKKRLELLSKACLETKEDISQRIYQIISNIDERKAKEIFTEMITIEKFQLDSLVAEALSLYFQNYGELMGELRKMKEKSSGRLKRRIEEFEQKFERALKLR